MLALCLSATMGRLKQRQDARLKGGVTVRVLGGRRRREHRGGRHEDAGDHHADGDGGSRPALEQARREVRSDREDDDRDFEPDAQRVDGRRLLDAAFAGPVGKSDGAAERPRRDEDDVGEEPDADSSERAVQMEDDEALEGQAAVISNEIASVRRALERIEAGTYGECVKCGEPIAEGRLQARPEAAMCIECASAG